MATNEVFLDAAYAIALSAPNDQHHQRAEALAQQLEAEGVRLITTRATVLEISNALAKLRYRSAAVELLDSLEEDQMLKSCPFRKNCVGEHFSFTGNDLTRNGV